MLRFRVPLDEPFIVGVVSLCIPMYPLKGPRVSIAVITVFPIRFSMKWSDLTATGALMSKAYCFSWQ